MNNKSWVEYLRLITPITLVVIGWYLSSMDSKFTLMHADIKEIDAKLFRHLTNDEVHSPRSVTVMKPEWEAVQRMRDGQLMEIRNEIIDLKNYILSGDIKITRRG